MNKLILKNYTPKKRILSDYFMNVDKITNDNNYER